MENKVIAYFDGFNYYEGLRKKGWKKYYWQDLVKFVEFFLRPYQELAEVRYFSAIQKDLEKAKRQDKLFQVNKINQKGGFLWLLHYPMKKSSKLLPAKRCWSSPTW